MAGPSHEGAAEPPQDGPADAVAGEGPSADVTGPEGPRSRGWLAIAGLGAVAALFSVVQPALLIFVPLALLWIGLPPRKPFTLAMAALIGWLTFVQTPRASVLWNFERGWVLLLGAWFVLLAALRPRWSVSARALAATAAAAITTAGFFVVNREGLQRLDVAVREHLQQGASGALAAWQRLGETGVSEDVRLSVERAAAFQAAVYPALLAIASLAALAVAWWAFSRLSRGEVRPLAPLREFRFSNELVWLLIASILLLAVPLDGVLDRIGQNLLLFMAVLYALRGVAVLLMVSGVPGPFGLVVASLLVVFMYPFVMAAAFMVGLSDTWLDIRARRAASSGPRS